MAVYLQRLKPWPAGVLEWDPMNISKPEGTKFSANAVLNVKNEIFALGWHHIYDM